MLSAAHEAGLKIDVNELGSYAVRKSEVLQFSGSDRDVTPASMLAIDAA
jgi:hypothetical protein